MNWKLIVKDVISFCASTGVSTVVSNIVSATMPKDAKLITKVSTAVGGFVLSAMISSKASEFIEVEFDKLVKPDDIPWAELK